MATFQPLKQLLPTIIISSIISVLALVRLLVQLVTQGPKAVFHYKKRTQRPALLEDPALGEHGSAKLKDVTLHYVSKGDASKPLMLFLHGFPEFWFSWRHQIRHFSGQYRTVAVDMRGYGESERPSGIAAYTMDQLVEDVHQLIPALGHEKCTLVAHDWGGAIAHRFANVHPEQLEKLVVVNCPHFRAFQKYLRSHFSQLKKSWYMFMFQAPWLGEVFLRSNDFAFIDTVMATRVPGSSRAPCTPEEVEAYKYSLSQPGGVTGPVNYYRASLRYKLKDIPRGKIAVPSLLVWGEQDTALEKGLAEATREQYADLRVRYIPTASHWAPQDEPEQVNTIIENFLSGKKEE